MYLMKKNNSDKLKNYFIKYIALLITIIIASYFSITFLINNKVAKSGINRIINIENLFHDKPRARIRHMAYASLKKSPIIGHGIGSVFFEMGIWTHNLFTDIFVEGGVIYLIIWIVLIAFTMISAAKHVRYEKESRFFFAILMIGAIISMLSGYYLANTALMSGIIYFLQGDKIRTKTGRRVQRVGI